MEQSKVIGILKTVFGYDCFRGQQQKIIENLLAGNDALVLMPTGGGKSLCYQIPALVSSGVGIVISPLIALMQDQVNAMHQIGVKAAFLNSTLSYEQICEIEQQLLANELDLLYIAPERLIAARTIDLFKGLKIALFAIDEAHCVSQWGHDFRVDYLQLSMLHQQFPKIPRIALTATADARTREEIIQRLDLDPNRVFVSGFDRPNIRYQIIQKQNARNQLLAFIRAEHSNDTGIVYCLSRKKVESTASWLQTQGVNALPYHAGMPAEMRRTNQHRFLMEDGLVIVATIAFGMGIDKPNVRFVAHLDLPKSIEAYYQETGRAGRDGLAANAWMVYGLQDVITLRQMLGNSNADEKHKRIELHKLDAMLSLCEQVSCRRQALLSYFSDHLDQPCNNCDTCLEPVKTWDGTVAAQQGLSCIYRTGQRFGVNYLIDVLRGKSDERIKSFGHDQQSTFAVGKQFDQQQWRSVFRQLIAKDMVEVDLEGYGGLKLAPACRPVLRGEATLMLRKDVKATIDKTKNRQDRQLLANKDTALWEAMREKRKQLANAQDVPPFMIFHDATLMKMIEVQPSNQQQLLAISGIGEKKLALYGDDFLAVLESFRNAQKDIGESADESLEMFKLGMTAEQIAEQRQLTVDTIYLHLAQGIEQGSLPLAEVVGLQANEIAIIEQAILDLPVDQRNTLKPVYTTLDGAYNYGVLRCVRAGIRKAYP